MATPQAKRQADGVKEFLHHVCQRTELPTVANPTSELFLVNDPSTIQLGDPVILNLLALTLSP